MRCIKDLILSTEMLLGNQQGLSQWESLPGEIIQAPLVLSLLHNPTGCSTEYEGYSSFVYLNKEVEESALDMRQGCDRIIQ